MEIILISDELNQLQRHDKGEDYPGNRKNDGFREGLHHTENAAVPRLGGHADLGGDVPHLIVHTVEHPAQIAENTADQQLFQPVSQGIPYETHRGLPPFSPLPPAREGHGIGRVHALRPVDRVAAASAAPLS